MNALTVLCADDWQGLFVNGVLQEEAHEIALRDLAGYCPIASLVVRELPAPAIEYLTSCGGFPNGCTVDEALALTPDAD